MTSTMRKPLFCGVTYLHVYLVHVISLPKIPWTLVEIIALGAELPPTHYLNRSYQRFYLKNYRSYCNKHHSRWLFQRLLCWYLNKAKQKCFYQSKFIFIPVNTDKSYSLVAGISCWTGQQLVYEKLCKELVMYIQRRSMQCWLVERKFLFNLLSWQKQAGTFQMLSYRTWYCTDIRFSLVAT